MLFLKILYRCCIREIKFNKKNLITLGYIYLKILTKEKNLEYSK